MVFDRIRSAYPTLTESQQRLARHILASYQEAAFMTASRLSQVVGLNEATVVRFAQRLGYSGYPGLIEGIRAVVQDDLDASVSETEENDAPAQVLVIQTEIMRQQIAHVSPTSLRLATEWLVAAQFVAVIGQGACSGLASSLAYGLSAQGAPAWSSPADALSLDQLLRRLDDQALLITLSTGDETPDFAAHLTRAREQGVHTLALAQSPLVPSAQLAQLALCLLPHTDPLGPTVAAVALLVDALMVLYAHARTAEQQSG